MSDRIVVATDGGIASRAALDWVVNRAIGMPCEVELVTVEDLDWLPLGFDRAPYLHRYEEALEAARDYLANRNGIGFVATRLLVGDPGEEIAAAGGLAGMLVIGSPLASSDSGSLHGTLALRIAATTATLLTVVPSDWEPKAGGIVVGVDDDAESSDAALDVAVREAVQSSRPLIVVHAWSLPAPFSLIEKRLEPTFPHLESLHRDFLDRAAARIASKATEVDVRCVLQYGHPAQVLSNAAHGEALLVVGSHRHGRLAQLFLGSVGHDVILAASSPVMVVPILE